MNQGLGWHRDLPDVRDYTAQTPSILRVLAKVAKPTSKKALPPSVDLRSYCSPIEDQGTLGSCTSHAAVGMLEYFEKRAYGKHVDASRLFVYKVTRNLLQWNGDTGAYLRTAMLALVTFGAPPEKYWAYNEKDFELEPPAFCYQFANRFKAVEYYRLDPSGQSPADTLTAIKRSLAAGLTAMFGFTVYDTIPALGGSGDIPYPTRGAKVDGGHAVLAVGYDDARKIGSDTGAILIRNSWGTGWGERGYGWLPYRYVLSGLATDWWSLVKADFLDVWQFE